MSISQQEVRNALYYRPETGEFFARFGTKNRLPWRRVGTRNSGGYIVINLRGKNYYAHVLAIVYMTGEYPSGHTDHRNGDRSDNRIDNLRATTASVNGQNRRSATKSSSTGLLGVHRKRNKFRARITVDRKEYHLGSFDTAEEAHTAYLNAKRQLHEGNTL